MFEEPIEKESLMPSSCVVRFRKNSVESTAPNVLKF